MQVLTDRRIYSPPYPLETWLSRIRFSQQSLQYSEEESRRLEHSTKQNVKITGVHLDEQRIFVKHGKQTAEKIEEKIATLQKSMPSKLEESCSSRGDPQHTAVRCKVYAINKEIITRAQMASAYRTKSNVPLQIIT
ncbi:hypothetical protein JTB14_009721 [Gonioctena quinquepunctata]|nr:hypothetical protein JTB14_009721 [Gonioctena quinquepunctata]